MREAGARVELFVVSEEDRDMDLEGVLGGLVPVEYFGSTGGWRTWTKLAIRIRRGDPDILFAANHRVACSLVLVRFVFGLRARIVARNISNLTQLLAKLPRWRMRVLRRLYRHVDIVIAQCVSMADDLVDNFGISRDSVRTVYNPVKLDHGRRRSSDRGRTVLFVGRLTEEKRLPRIIASLARLRAEGLDLQFEIVGRGPLEPRLRELITAKAYGDWVSLGGYTKDVIAHYITADVVVLHSEYEGFPNVLLEAISCGVPVVSSNTPFGPAEIIIDGANGFLAARNDDRDLGEKVRAALARDWDPSQVVRTVERFDADRFAAAIEALFAAASSRRR